MAYIFKGRLCGYICDECPEPLSHVKVRLYRTRKEQNATALVAAQPKDTFAILDEKQVKEKSSSLIGEYETDDAGNFTADLGSKYDGGAVEVDVYCETVPGRKETPKPPKPLQFSITVVQPEWRPLGRDSVAIWNYCLSQRYWCLVRSRFHAWVICGHITVCNSRRPAPGLKVSAFDVDWLQDDALGSAVTDANGRFRINYSPADFKKDIFGFNVELFGGPDLYFRVETPSGTVLLNEPPSRGRDADRENVGNCVCVHLCVEELPEVTHAWFTRVGDFALYSDINHLTDGLTKHEVPFGFAGAHAGAGFGFFGHMKLVGDCPTTYPGGGGAMRYRFQYEEVGSGTGLQPMTSGNIATVVVGTRPITWDVDGTGPRVTSQPIYIVPGGDTGVVAPTPPPAVLPPAGTDWGPIPAIAIGPDADGWIRMPLDATNSGFSGPLVRFASESVVSGSPAPTAIAGNDVNAANRKVGKMLRIVFEAEPVSGATIANPTLHNEISHIYINNSAAVNALNLAEYVAAGNACEGITTHLGIQYTADHEFMTGWSVSVSGAATPFPTIAPPLPSATEPASPTPPPSGVTSRGGFGTRTLDTSAWPRCSYTVTLTTQRKLTDGENEDPALPNSLTFCKK